MTCVYNAIYSRFTNEEKALLGEQNIQGLVKWVKNLHIQTPDVTVQGVRVTEKEMKENIERLDNIQNINHGYDMSGSDPLLIVLSQKLGWEIHFKYLNTLIIIKNTKKTSRKVCFSANRGHFS